jgi:ATP-binding cassette, subfamily C, bacterial PrsD
MSGRLAGDSTSAIRNAVRETRGEWLHVAVFSVIVNLLMLTGSIYMLQVYDRVLASRSIPTLVGLTVIVLLAFALQGVLEAMRQRMLGRIGAKVDEKLAPFVGRALTVMPVRGAGPHEALEPLRDLETLRTFLSNPGPTALIDMPFMLLFTGVCYLLHPWLGIFTIVSCILIVTLTLFAERRSARPNQDLNRRHAERSALAEATRRNAEVLSGLGMAKDFQRRFVNSNADVVRSGLALTEATSGITSLAKVTRYVMQSTILGLGAYLVIRGELSPGAMIAASILTTRALAPVELAVAHWRQFSAARQSYARLKLRLPLLAEPALGLLLPPPRVDLELRDLVVAAPGQMQAVVHGVGFRLKSGEALGIVGPSGSGKSSLARAIVGAWPAARGEVRLDGALIGQWSPEALGRSFGYLPQDVELFEGTIAENIARFEPGFSDDAVLKAAAAAGAHGMITGFPKGYNTALADGGAGLSGGQRQRIALARALYGDPFLVVLDEPNANLDQAGDEALSRAILDIRQRGGIVIIITHRHTALAGVNLLVILKEGRLAQFGPRDQVLQALMPRPPGQQRWTSAATGIVPIRTEQRQTGSGGDAA